MARKKKDENKEVVAENATVTTGTPLELTQKEETNTNTEQKVEEKKEKKTRAKTTKKATPKTKKASQTTAKEEKKEQPIAEIEQEIKEVEPEKIVEKKATSPKAKREKKPPVKKTEEKTVTKAEKNETIKSVIKELLSTRPYKWSELLDESARLYEQKIEEKDGHVANDVRGRIGSVFDVMKKENEVSFEGGMYALKRISDVETDEKPVAVIEELNATKPEKLENTENKESTAKQLPAVKEKAEVAPVFDLSLLLGENSKPTKQVKEVKVEEPKQAEVAKKPSTAEENSAKPTSKTQEKKEKSTPKKAVEQKQEKRIAQKQTTKAQNNKLKELFLKRIRALGGKYFEYYSIYLLERYSLRNGRRVDGFKVSGGDNDGGIDGEIEVTDRIGFKETIYIQAKNWKPIYGKEDSWVIGETALREFIGAVAYRQAKEGKQRCRGIFITTSYFTAGAKDILEKMSDSFVGYDGDDLFETAKECSFGLIEKDGEWQLDERLFAGDKAFFNLYD